MERAVAEGLQDNINQYWDTYAGAYEANQRDQLRHPAVHRAWADVWSAALPAPPATVLDVGTGSGHVSVLLASLGHQVTGIDLAEAMLDEARRRTESMPTPPTLMVGDAVDPPFPPGTFDAVTSRYVLWTLCEPQVALANRGALLRPGGTFAAVDSTWFPDGIRTNDPDQLSTRQADFQNLYDDRVLATLPLAQSRSIEDTADLVRAAGFRNVAVTELRTILDLDRELGVSPGHELRVQFLITGQAQG